MYQHFTKSEIQKLVHKGRLQYDFTGSTVKGDFDCSYMGLTTLEGVPSKVEGAFNCANNKLRNLKHAPIKVAGFFNCSSNPIKNLIDLDDNKRFYYDLFICQNTAIRDLIGIQQAKIKKIDIRNNKFLKSIEGIPAKSTIAGNFHDYDSNIMAQLDWYIIHSHSNYNYVNFWANLLKYYMKNNSSRIEIIKWPKGFLTDDTIKSVKGINKFSL
jgi:hypothetical protein